MNMNIKIDYVNMKHTQYHVHYNIEKYKQELLYWYKLGAGDRDTLHAEYKRVSILHSDMLVRNAIGYIVAYCQSTTDEDVIIGFLTEGVVYGTGPGGVMHAIFCPADIRYTFHT